MSFNSLFKIFLFILAIAALYYFRDILVTLVLAFIISLALSPLIDFFEKKKIPRVVSTLVIFSLFLGIIISLFAFISPTALSQFKGFILNFRETSANIINAFFPKEVASSLVQGLNQNFEIFLKDTKRILDLAFSFVGGLSRFFVIVILSFYLSLEKNALKKLIKPFLKEEYYQKFSLTYDKIQKRISSWFLTQLFLCLIIGIFSFLALYLLNVKFAFVLAVLSGVLEIVPIFGPLISGFIAFLIASSSSLIKGIWVVIAFIIIQRLENDLLVPLVMKKTLKINPVLILIALLMGSKLAGFLGFILAIPVLVILQETYQAYK